MHSQPAHWELLCIFACCVLLGVGLRAGERAARAWIDAECVAEVWAELVEVRQQTGTGVIADQAWTDQLVLDLSGGTLGLFDERPAEPGYEEFYIEREAAP